MSFIDWGAILRVNGKFINKNKDLFMNCSDTGYICEKAEYPDGTVRDISGNYFVYAGDENFLIVFYKGIFHVIHNNKIIYSDWNISFNSETFYFEGLPTLKVEHLDENIYFDPVESAGTWEDYVREQWIGATGKEKLSELENGSKRYKRFKKNLKRIARERKNPSRWYRYKTDRWLATWEYNGKKYEVIFGSGIDPNEKVWNDIKYDCYRFTDVERQIIDSWFEEYKESEIN